VQDDEDTESLVAGELMLSPSGHEHRLSGRKGHILALNGQGSTTLEHDVELVVFVRLLAIGSGAIST
jgi:hypothetical protein